MNREQLLSVLSSHGQNIDSLLGLVDQALEIFEPHQLTEAMECFRDFGEMATRTVDEEFRLFCQDQGHTLLRQLQVGGNFEARSSVFLVLDADGVVKVYKELSFDEPALYERLSAVLFLPQCYGVTHIGSAYFMRLEVVYGQSLADYVHADNHLTPDEAVLVVGQIAHMLGALHERGVAYLDVRPENFKINGPHLSLLDLGDARVLEENEVRTHIHDAAYVAPETVQRGVASTASDIWQLGILLHKLLTGKHPFLVQQEISGQTWVEQVVHYGVANTQVPYEHDLAEELGDPRFSILHRMLAKDPSARPSAHEVAKVFASPPQPHFKHRGRAPIAEYNGTVLFPARMGIPHRGHIDFMARILELGFKLVVSLQASYVQTSIDPLPKWLVAKMVARSLEQKGFDPSKIRFLFTPLFETESQHKLHFAMMPEGKEIVAVASGNPEVHALFAGRYPVLDQRTVFGNENQDYETRSWGEQLRHAVRVGDRGLFHELIAPGALQILSFDEMQKYCRVSETPIIYARGNGDWGNIVVVLTQDGEEIFRQRVNTYVGPERTLVNALPNTYFIDPFARNSLVSLDNTAMQLQYERIELDRKKNFVIHFRLLPLGVVINEER